MDTASYRSAFPRFLVLAALVPTLAALSACDDHSDAAATAAPAATEAPIVYGVDNRVEVYQATDLQRASAAATVALIDASRLSAREGGYAIAGGLLLGDAQQLCSSERFIDQPVAAFCSGFLVGPELIATAGHCITKASECAAVRLVFGFDMLEGDGARLDVASDDVYGCAAIVEGKQDAAGVDYAILRLDRPVVGHAPLATRLSGSVASGQSLYVIGHPSGIPTKVAAGGAVKNNAPAGYFEANLDTYGGNSGSAVFNAETGLVEGILVRGNTDYRRSKGCYVTNVCSDANGCWGSWEDVTRATEFAQVLAPCSDDAACDDGDPCTADACVAGTCVSGPDTCCGELGTSCTTASDCCSNRCSGGRCKRR